MATARIGRHSTVVRNAVSWKIRDLKGPTSKLEVFDASNMDSTGGRDKIPDDVADHGDLVLEIENPTTAVALDATARSTVVTYNGQTARTMDTYITGFEPSAPQAGIQTATLTLTVTGNIT